MTSDKHNGKLLKLYSLIRHAYKTEYNEVINIIIDPTMAKSLDNSYFSQTLLFTLF